MTNSPRIVVLIGYMGSGKSVIGNLLAKQLHLPFVDSDDCLESKAQQSITQIFEEQGELGFRKMERNVLHELLTDNQDKVLSLGGGTPCYFDNMDVITQHTSKVVYLDTSIQVLVERLLKEKNDRPVIAHLDSKESLTEFVGKHLFERRPFYRKAPIIIAIQNQYPSEVVQQIDDSL